MPKLIKRLVAGQTPSLLDSEKGNELIDTLNSILQMQVNPQGFGKISAGDKNLILDLTQIRDLINQLSTTVAAFAQASGGGGAGGSGGGGSSTEWRTAYNALVTAIADLSIDAVCDPGAGTITVTLNIDLPPLQ